MKVKKRLKNEELLKEKEKVVGKGKKTEKKKNNEMENVEWREK